MWSINRRFHLVLAVLVFFIVGEVISGALPKIPCDSGDVANAPTPVNIIVDKCSSVPCKLIKGETYNVEIDFDVERYTNDTLVEVFGIIAGLEVPWNGVGADGCSDIIVGYCPMHPGDYWTYGVSLKVEPIYPTTALIIKWLMRDDQNLPIWCFHLPAEIVPA